jgi:hypothetical protein
MSNDLLKVFSFKITSRDGYDVEVEGSDRFCHERDVKAFKDATQVTISEQQAKIEEAADLLDQCAEAFQFIAQDDCECDECSKARQMLAAIRAVQEKNNE